MKLVAFALLLAVLGSGIAQEMDVGQQLRDTIAATNALDAIPETNDCRQIIVDLLAGCTVEIYPNSEFAEILETLVNIAEDGSVSLMGGALASELTAIAGDPTRTLSAAGCCSFACELARSGCGCDQTTYNALLAFFGQDAVALLEQFKDICEADNASLSFELTVFGTDSCNAGFEATTATFVCS